MAVRRERHLISILIPCHNEAGNLEILSGRIADEMKTLGQEFEVIFINDGSKDDTEAVLKNLHKRNPSFKFISLSRNFGHQPALKAGLDHAEGDAVVMMDGDLQHPPELIVKLIEAWKNGAQIVNTSRLGTEGEGFFKTFTSRLFYWIFRKLSGISMSAGSADFRLLDRQVVLELRKFSEPPLFFRGLIEWIGFEKAVVPYRADSRHAGKTKYSLKKMLRFSLDGIMSFSVRPLRLAGIVGFGITCFAFLYLAYALGIVIFTDRAVSGWASILMSVLFLGGVQMIFLGLLGEYVGKIFVESKARPAYIVKEAALSTPQKVIAKDIPIHAH